MAQTPYTLQQLINAMSLGYQDQELLRQAFGISPDPNSTWVANLPTTLPATAGVLWNNGGVLSIS